jgi:hypothetical protein
MKAQDVAETAAELALTLGSSKDFWKVYEKNEDSLGGRVGLAGVIARVSRDMERFASRHWGTQYDWYLSVDNVAGALIARAFTLLTSEIKHLLVSCDP